MENLTCKICESTYNQDKNCPRLFKCGHTVCENCLKNLLANPKCPFCKMTQNDYDISSYSKNFAILDLLEDSKSNIAYSDCLKHKIQSEFVCFDCQNVMCFECLIEDHCNHNTKKVEEFVTKISSKLSKKDKIMKECDEKSEVFKKVINCMVRRIRDQVVKKTKELIDSIEQNKQEILLQLDELESRCTKRIESCYKSFEKWNLQKIDANRLFEYNNIVFEDWDIRAEIFLRGDVFYENLKEIAHSRLVWDDLLESSKIKEYFYLDQSSCEKENCQSNLCEKVKEYNLAKFDSNEIPNNFSFFSLNVLKSEFIYHKDKIYTYYMECKIEKYMKENIDILKSSTTNCEILQNVSDYFMKICKDERKYDRAISKEFGFNEMALVELQLKKDLSFEYFLLAYLSCSSAKNFFLRNYSGPNGFFNNIKTLIRKLHYKDKKITTEEFNSFYNATNEKLSTKNDVIFALMKFISNIKTQILRSKVKLNKLQSQEISDSFELKCTKCENITTKIISPFILQLPEMAYISYKTYSLSKVFNFYLPMKTSLESLKSKIISLTPEIDPDKILVLNSQYKTISMFDSLSSRVWVFENPSKISLSTQKITAGISYTLGFENPRTFYFIILGDKMKSTEQDIKTLLGMEYIKIEYDDIDYDILTGNLYNTHSEPGILVELSQVPRPNVQIDARFLLDKLQNYECINCKTPSAVITHYPDNLLIYFHQNSVKSLDFKIGDYLYEDSKLVPHRLNAVLTINHSPRVEYSTYMRISNKKQICKINENRCDRIENSLITAEPVVMLYSICKK